MEKVSFDQLLDAGVHFGHLKRKWNPAMAPYIFMEKNGIHIIDLYKTQAKLEEAKSALKQIAKNGKKILFVATKKQAKDIVSELVQKTNMPYVTERWPGGMLTNFVTIRKAVKKMTSIDKLESTPQYQNLSKRERLQITRERAKLEKNFGSISDLHKLPSAIFVVDINKEHIAVAEAKKLNIPTFAIVDTNTNPTLIDFPVPANDDASKSIALIIEQMTNAISEGLTERKMAREKAQAEEKVVKAAKAKQKADKAAAEAKAKTEAAEKKKESAEQSEGEDKAPRKRLANKKVETDKE
ncbi:MAG: 30S ribosomal protein S2 [Bacteroidetes bacterium 4572_77]|nr:MAG: 30S ribosomal protein S2 [Bacteroidetes bacterium 4572_77]